MINLYTTDTCSRCKVLKSRLKSKGIDFKEITNKEVLKSLGIMSVPQMRIDDGELMDFNNAIKYINSLEV